MWKLVVILGLICGFIIVSASTTEESTSGKNVGTATSTTGTGSGTGTGTGAGTGTGTGTGTGFVTTDSVLTTGINPPDPCEGQVACSDCVTSTTCVWCQQEASCRIGLWYGPTLQSCSDWRWKQCEVNGKYALLGVVCAIAVFLLCLLICICVCCCCARKRSDKLTDYKKFKALQLQEEEQAGLVSKHPKTDERRAELVKKYSSKLKSSSDV